MLNKSLVSEDSLVPAIFEGKGLSFIKQKMYTKTESTFTYAKMMLSPQPHREL